MGLLKITHMTIAVVAFLTFGGCTDLSNREDFASQLKNKTEPEVLRYAGKPVEVDKSDPGRILWIYKKRTFDVPTRKTDAETDVIFTASPDGSLHVAEVQFK
jgi:hypothetical protein